MAALALTPAGIYVDATFGRGGHSRAIMAQLAANGRLFAVDRDPDAIAEGRDWAAIEPRLTLWHAAFSQLPALLTAAGFDQKINGLLLDLGVSSPQLDSAERGFSFMRDGPLDMRMDTTQGLTVADWLAGASADDIAVVLQTYGEERYARRIAQAIVQQRLIAPLTTTHALAALCERAVPRREPGQHPATRTFQALRIYLNRELDELRALLSSVTPVLAAGARVVVISFHSLEDRLVKQVFNAPSAAQAVPKKIPLTAAELQQRYPPSHWRPLGRAITAQPFEIAQNPRARSARLRVAEYQP
ncbi:16S rRNA (cytosine(1402)-N(4))-methyltransferase RsmH [Thiospirillum jenense]|uniref:Ribosomal RNA small subunit methyltransferase H n=2 Tax=Thiospirillum jenense TaxID=1653858 RepID=A0A839HJP3_9GAMM|nr:16S rRNA (cytosine(1402)-N(4))-methyltransferase RsmH [Thiospirillum jenense]